MNEPGPLGARSAGALARLVRIPRFALIIGVVALTVGGFALRGLPGAVLLGALAVLVGWLAWLGWDTHGGAARVLRLAVVAALAAAAVLKLL